MDKHFFDLLHESIPKINEDLANGLAYRQMQHPEKYIDRAIRIAEQDFPPEVKYAGYHVCTPREEFTETVRKRSTPTTIELARRDFFMVKYKFTFFNGVKDEELVPWCLLLPIVGEGGLITINGSLYQISPVAVDVGLSVGQDEIFLKVNSNRLKFHRSNCEFMKDGEQVSTYVVWSRAHNRDAKPVGNRMMVKGDPTLAHYLFAKYGLTRTFNELANTDVVVGTEVKVNAANYPPEDWVICQSAFHLTRDVRPRGVKDKRWRPSNLRLAIPRKNYNLTTEGLIAGFFYVLDLFPQRFDSDEPEVDSTVLWRALLGTIYWGEGESDGKHLVDINAHIDFLDKEIDSVTQQNLAATGVFVNDIWGLFIHLIETYSTRVTRSITQLSSMYGKRLTTIDYVMQDILYCINNFKFAIQPSVHNNKRRALVKRDIETNIWSILKGTAITKITGGVHHPEVNSIAMPGDNKYFKGTSTLVLQSDSGGPKNSNAPTDGDPTKYLDISIAEAGSCFTMSKSEPTGRSRQNAYTTTDGDTIIRNPKLVELTDSTQRLIER